MTTITRRRGRLTSHVHAALTVLRHLLSAGATCARHGTRPSRGTTRGNTRSRSPLGTPVPNGASEQRGALARCGWNLAFGFRRELRGACAATWWDSAISRDEGSAAPAPAPAPSLHPIQWRTTPQRATHCRGGRGFPAFAAGPPAPEANSEGPGPSSIS